MKRTEQAVRDYIAQHQEELKQRVVNIFIGEIANAVFLAENKILGARETHRIVIQVQPEVAAPGDVMKKKGDLVMS